MLELFIEVFLINGIVCLSVSVILYIPVYSEVKDLKNEKFYIKRKGKLDLDNYHSTLHYLGVIFLPLTLVFSVSLKDYITLTDTSFFNLSQTIATLALSMFGIILFMDFFKEKRLDYKNNIEGYLNNRGYHTRISIMKYFVVFFIINFVLVNVDLSISKEIIEICKIEVLFLFLIYVVFYFFGSLRLLLNYIKFNNDKYAESYNILYTNYLNRPKLNIYVEDPTDLEQLIRTFAVQWNKLLRKHRESTNKKIKYVKYYEFKDYFRDRSIKLFIYSTRFFIFVYFIYSIIILFTNPLVTSNIIIYIIAEILILLLYLIIAYMNFKNNIIKDFNKVNAFAKMLIVRNREYNKFVIGDEPKIKIEENVELWADDYSKLCVLYFASTLNAFDQILSDKSKDKCALYIDFLKGILDVIEVYCIEITSKDSDFTEKEKKNYSIPCYSILCILEKCISLPKTQVSECGRSTILCKSRKVISQYKVKLEKQFEKWNENSKEVSESIISATLVFVNKK